MKKLGTVRNVSAEIIRWVKNKDCFGGHSEFAGRRYGNIEVWVDYEKLGRMLGNRALRSKGRKATLSHGAIKVKVVDEREEEV